MNSIQKTHCEGDLVQSLVGEPQVISSVEMGVEGFKLGVNERKTFEEKWSVGSVLKELKEKEIVKKLNQSKGIPEEEGEYCMLIAPGGSYFAQGCEIRPIREEEEGEYIFDEIYSIIDDVERTAETSMSEDEEYLGDTEEEFIDDYENFANVPGLTQIIDDYVLTNEDQAIVPGSCYINENIITGNDDLIDFDDDKCVKKDEDPAIQMDDDRIIKIIDFMDEVRVIQEDNQTDHEKFNEMEDNLLYNNTEDVVNDFDYIKTYKISNNYCKCPDSVQICKCMMSYYDKNKTKLVFNQDLIKDLTCIEQGFRLDTLLGKKLDCSIFRKHHSVKLACHLNDKKITCKELMNRGEFLNLVYSVRKYFGYDGNYGQKKLCKKPELVYEAQGLSDIFNSIVGSIKSLKDKSFKVIIKDTFKRVYNFISSIFSVVSSSLGNMIRIIFDKIETFIIKIIDPYTRIKEGMMTALKTLVSTIVGLLVVILIDYLGLLTFKLAYKYISEALSYFTSKSDVYEGYESEGPPDPVVAAVTLIGLILGIAKNDLKYVSDKCVNFSKIVSGGISISYFASSLFLVLPLALQSALKFKFGSEEDRQMEMIEEWMLKSTAVIRLKKISSVLTSEEYYTWISELINESHKLRFSIKSPNIGNQFVRNLVSMLEILAILENYRRETASRRYPFAIHIAGEPGLGKSLMASRFLRDVFECGERDIYTRPVSSDYWDGYINQPVIFYDEFLIGDKQSRLQQAKEILELISTKTFKPPLASVDDPSVGLKGTRAEPIGVLTTNNICYEKVESIDQTALQRRREFVIKVLVNPEYEHRVVNNKVDLNKMSSDEIRNFKWLIFDVRPALPVPHREQNLVDYKNLVQLVKDTYQRHKLVCDTISETLSSDFAANESPKKLLEQTLRELRGVPNKPLSITEALFSIFGNVKDSVLGMFKTEGSEENIDKNEEEYSAQGPTSPQGMDDEEEKLGPNDKSRTTSEEEEFMEYMFNNGPKPSKYEERCRKQGTEPEYVNIDDCFDDIEDYMESKSHKVYEEIKRKDDVKEKIKKSQEKSNNTVKYKFNKQQLKIIKILGEIKEHKSIEKIRSLLEIAELDVAKVKAYESTLKKFKKNPVFSKETQFLENKVESIKSKLSEPEFHDGKMKHKVVVEPVLTSGEEYFSPDENTLYVNTQKDVFAFIDHSNVDPQKLHMHRCFGRVSQGTKHYPGGIVKQVYKMCDGKITHKHENANPHLLLCKKCISDGNDENLEALNYHSESSNRYFNIVNPISNVHRESLPPKVDYEYVELDSDVRRNLNKMWLKIAVKGFLEQGQMPCFMPAGVENLEDYIGLFDTKPKTIFNKSWWKERARDLSVSIGIFVLSMGLVKLFGSEERREKVMDVDFTAQSAPPSRISKSATKQRNFKSGKLARAHGSSNTLQLEINGSVSYCIPIHNHVLLTYLHQFIDKNGNIRDETNLKINYLGKFESHQVVPEMITYDFDRDLAFVNLFNSKLSQFPNNIKRFWSDHDAESFRSTQCIFENPNQEKFIYGFKIFNKNYSHFLSGTLFKLEECIAYKGKSQKGDCGSAIISIGQNFPGKILGIHVAGGINGSEFYGLARIVTREDIEKAIKPEFEIDNIDIDFVAEGPASIFEKVDGPNLKHKCKISNNEQVHLTRKSKLQPSLISNDIIYKPQKHLPLLSPYDDRAQGQDPVVNMINDTLSITRSEIDEVTLKRVSKSTFANLKNNLKCPIELGTPLTFEQALKGIPGVLSSLRVKTSAGYPLCKVAKKKGKTDFFWFDDEGEVYYDLKFKQQVLDFKKKLESEEKVEGRFVVFLKDELQSLSKINEKRCRIIYCGDLIANVAYRMIFGSILVAIQNSYQTIPSAIGFNQYSWDMHEMYDYLTEVGENFIAGDYKNFDKRIHPAFAREAYNIVLNLIPDSIVSRKIKDNFIHQQRFSPAQVGDALIYFHSTHYSGCFLTSIINNIVNELYFRYCFSKLCPNYMFDDHVRLKVLGDDHIISVSDTVKSVFNPFNIRDQLKLIDQVYTSDIKDAELTNEFRKFEEISFLGAYPRLIGGKYCGALKKSTLQETILWTRNKNLTLITELETAVELASVWEKEYYEEYTTQINYALQNVGLDPIRIPPQEEMQLVVASRKASTGINHPSGFWSEGPELVKLNETRLVEGATQAKSVGDKLRKLALNEVPQDLSFGYNSDVYRLDIEWKQSDIVGKAIASYKIPFGLLSKGGHSNVQNMPFDRFMYWSGDVEVKFQINATPFTQGLLVAYFVPLAEYQVELRNITACSHVKIIPSQSSTYSLRIPFRYYRSVINTTNVDIESLGILHLTPMSLLQAGDGQDSVNISIYTSFPDSLFSIPRALSPPDVKVLDNKYDAFGNRDFDNLDDVIFEAQGNSTSVSYNYSAGGNMPMQNGGSQGAVDVGQATDVSPEVSVPVPFDNPPLASGALPTVPQIPGMSSAFGTRVTNDMQLKPATFARQHNMIFNPAETKIEYLLGLPCLLTSFKIQTGTQAGTELIAINLNSFFGVAYGAGAPLNVAILNQFFNYRCDVKLTFMAVRTQFHSTRLQVLVGYGEKTMSLTNRTSSYSSIVDFSLDNSVVDVLVPYNAQTEFLRTVDTPILGTNYQDYSQGVVSVILLNKLKAPSTVTDEIEVLTFISFENPKVAVPRNLSPFNFFEQNNAGPTIGPVNGNKIINFEGIGQFTFFEIENLPSYKVFDNMQPINPETYMTVTTSTGSVQVKLLFTQPNLKLRVSIPDGRTVQNGDTVVMAKVDLKVLEVFEAQGPETETDIEHEALGDIPQEALESSTTEQATPERKNQIYATEFDQKFEFCISDVHEIARRYICFNPETDDSISFYADKSKLKVYQNADGTNEIKRERKELWSFGTQPMSIFRKLYAAWCGGIKYRIIYENFPQSCHVFFGPYFRPKGRAINPVIGVDAMNKYRLFWNEGENSYYSTTVQGGMGAREMLFPTGTSAYVDVSVPFQLHHNFCATTNDTYSSPVNSGTLSILYPDPDEPETGHVERPILFSAFADDTRFGIFRVPQFVTFAMSGFQNGFEGFDFPVSKTFR
ncbi:polyprotein [Basavirus sp.]|nr:polyprotein [Basavirus sp.]